MKVRKRDGRIEEFDEQKIVVAIQKAIDSVGNVPSINSPEVIAASVACKFVVEVTVDEIHDEVEKELMSWRPDVAKVYILYRARHAELPHPDSKAIETYIHAAKYARGNETYSQTVTRVKNMHIDKFSLLSTTIVYDICKAFEDVEDKRCLPSMRSMQFAGAAIQQHNARVYNCSFTLIDRPEVFGQALYLLLCGCGVGYSVQKQHVDKLPVLMKIDRSKVFHFTVSDSVEGWADALIYLVSCYTSRQYYVEFSYHFIRPEGEELKTSGGVAPGHLPMKKMLEDVRVVLDGAQGRKLKPIECHDIMCYVAKCVLAGGIRRSSLIALFSKDDQEMLYCKTGDFPEQRALANNSVVLLRSATTKQEFIDLMALNKTSHGEPGFFFCEDEDWGCNPCGEIMLYPKFSNEGSEHIRDMDDPSLTGFAFCNLTEVNAARCTTKEEFLHACESAAIIGTLQSTYTKFPYLGEVSERIALRDALIGVSITGIQDNPKCMEWMEDGRQTVVDVNEAWAKKLGINRAKRTTCIKPSGTASLELGCVASGIHYHHAARYFRRVVANPNEAVAQKFKEVNPHMVEEMPSGDWCITFPIEAPRGVQTMKNYMVSCFLGEIFRVYDSWIDGHNISSTVVFKDEDWEDIIETVWKHRASIAAMTFLPAASDKQIPYMPREAVETEGDEIKFKNLVDNFQVVDYSGVEGLQIKEAGCESCEGNG